MVRGVDAGQKRNAGGSNVGEWLVNVSGDVVLPMTTLEVIDGVRKGRLSEQSLVWRVGMHDWTSIADVPQLRLAAGSRTPPPAAARVTLPPLSAQAEVQRRRNTLPFGFPAVRDPATVRRPAGFEEPLAVYDRPVASLTFSASGRADWQHNLESPRLTPVPPVAAPLSIQPAPSIRPNSLAPTTAEAKFGEGARAPEAWDNLDELLSNERRADQRSSRRVVVAAAVGSATLAAVFALWVLQSPAARQAEPSVQASEPSPAPVLAPTLEAIAAPSASALEPAPAATPISRRSLPPHVSRRAKTAPSARSSRATRGDLQGAELMPETTASAPSVTVVPLEPALAASAPSEVAPQPPAVAPSATTPSATPPSATPSSATTPSATAPPITPVVPITPDNP